MTEINIGHAVLTLSVEGNGVRVKSYLGNAILRDQDIETISGLIRHNHAEVNNHYKLIVDKANGDIDAEDLNKISISIVIHYLYMYNLWRNTYQKQKSRKLEFDNKDFDKPATYDLMTAYFKAKFPYDWEEKCAILSGMGLYEFNKYYEQRQAFFNK